MTETWTPPESWSFHQALICIDLETLKLWVTDVIGPIVNKQRHDKENQSYFSQWFGSTWGAANPNEKANLQEPQITTEGDAYYDPSGSTPPLDSMENGDISFKFEFQVRRSTLVFGTIE